ncbi:MAG: hypothetical protein HGA45_39425 [Chloroflexales bacterium]|nr:hypothetical protein [Chloroflexales bacterium]
MTMADTLDKMFVRLLRVTPQPVASVVEDDADAERADHDDEAPAARAFGLALVISGLRCTLQYVVLPVILPLIGVMSDLSLPLVILLDGLALVMLVRSLRYYWRTLHPRRFDMLPLSGLILFIILGSLGYDLWQLLN